MKKGRVSSPLRHRELNILLRVQTDSTSENEPGV